MLITHFLFSCRRPEEKPNPVPQTIASPVDRNSNSPVPLPIENKPPPIPIVTCDFASDISTSDNAEGPQDPGGGGGGAGGLSVSIEVQKDTLKVSFILFYHCSIL